MDGDRHHHVQIVAVAPVDRMGRDVDRDVQIARQAASIAGVALARHADAIALGDPRGKPDGDRFGA